MDPAMWQQLGLSAGAVILLAAALTRLLSRNATAREFDVGVVSEGWLAERRASKSETSHG
jgi:hypothetical protein